MVKNNAEIGCLLAAGLLMIIGGGVQAGPFHRFHSGECPKIGPMADFQIDRFLGQWYVLENANDNVDVCLREEFRAVQEEVTSSPSATVITSTTTRKPEVQEQTKIEMEDEPDMEMARLNEVDSSAVNNRNNRNNRDESIRPARLMEKVYQVRRSYLPFGGRQFITETGKVRFLSNESLSEMEISFPYAETGMLNLKHYQVVATDYDKYALIWRCQRTIFGHRRSAQLLSRYPSLDKQTMQEIKALLRHFEHENEIKFVSVRQTDCGPMEENEKKKQPESTGGESGAPEDNSSGNAVGATSTTGTTVAAKKPNKKKLISIEVGGFQLSISYPFF